MKTAREIQDARAKVNNADASEYPGMTYENGIVEALGWVLGDISDEEFEYAEGFAGE